VPSSVEFINAHGETVSGRLALPVGGTPAAYAVFAHCLTPSAEPSAEGNISLALAQAGLAVLSIDFAGPHEEGTRSETRVAASAEHVLAAARFLEQAHHAPQLLIGHSLGGAAVLMATRNLPSVRAVATINTPGDASYLKLMPTPEPRELEHEMSEAVMRSGRSFPVDRTLLENLEVERMKALMRSLNRALLILHAPQDTVVAVDSAAQLFRAAQHPKSFVSLDGADHLLTGEHDSRYVGSVIAAWARRYLKPEPQPSWQDDVHDNRVVVRTHGILRTEMMANGFPLVADEPKSLGGTDMGPTPYDYVAAALGACTSMTLRMYADRKGWPLDAVTVTVKHSKVHVQDCLDCEKPKAKLDQFERELSLEGNLDEEQRARLLEIAERCPVHRTLESRVQITSRLKDTPAPSETAKDER
jgi:uncharacterized OsmC-like protein/alpha-beta hydrolase superfamily lysophospholipase